MSSIPWRQRHEAEDPRGPTFESVSELTERIKRSLETDFGQVALHGEVSNVARPRSGHIYFTIKDELASIRAVMWKNDSRRVAFDLTDGLAVRALGRLTVYAPRGEYQIVVSAIEPEGMGALELAFRQRYARLALEGLFDTERKRPLPRFPRRIVIVTSPTGAAVRDILQVLSRRWRCASVLVAPTRVQGVGADMEVVAALDLANHVAQADVIILARGGGSLEDLWTFNEEIVVRAIVTSRLPVVSAIGHEIDVTLADLAADRRALTPSEAGEVCVPDAREVTLHLDRLADRLRLAGSSQLRDARARLDQLAKSSLQAIQQDLVGRRQQLRRLGASLDALSPLAVLARGYSLTFLADGKTLVRSSEDVKSGELIRTHLAAGQISSHVV
ncbi:MAG TPA: exodeoxyribonuclease VII large subunit [Isosphaeraceae bacterium]|nr:exodeoxyribonuclease VII large subunit [Isosphaeraceae bacterium]